MTITEPQKLAAALCCALALIASACGGGGLRTLIPQETLSQAHTWRIVHEYDLSPPADPRLRPTPEQRSLIDLVRAQASPQVKLTYAAEGAADIVVTLEQRYQQAGYGQVSGLTRREVIWWVRFHDSEGKKVGEFVERNQSLINSSNQSELARKLAGEIATALNAQSQ